MLQSINLELYCSHNIIVYYYTPVSYYYSSSSVSGRKQASSRQPATASIRQHLLHLPPAPPWWLKTVNVNHINSNSWGRKKVRRQYVALDGHFSFILWRSSKKCSIYPSICIKKLPREWAKCDGGRRQKCCRWHDCSWALGVLNPTGDTRNPSGQELGSEYSITDSLSVATTQPCDTIPGDARSHTVAPTGYGCVVL